MDGFWAKGLYSRLCAAKDLSWAHMFHSSVALQRIQDAPFLIGLKRGHRLTKWLVEEGWGKWLGYLPDGITPETGGALWSSACD